MIPALTSGSSVGSARLEAARPWLGIDTAAIVANARAMSLRAAPARLCAVLKSNAYGHGLVPVARSLAGAGIAGLRFGVFSAEEALALRDAGLREPILVLGPASDLEVAELVRRQVELAALEEADVERFAPHQPRVHVKVDSGTSRFGIAPDRAAEALARFAEVGIQVAGVYSHLADSESLNREFTLDQLKTLLRLSGEDGPKGPWLQTPALRHIAASAAAMIYPETRLDMVRCGIAIYGGWPSPEVTSAMEADDPDFELQPALRWYAPVVQVRDVGPGDTVGYGCEFTASRASRIAVLPAGYADGLPRAAGLGRAQVAFDAGWAPIVGRVCMNACMVDVTDLEPQPVRGSVARLSIDNIARAAGTINYEVLARLPQELERRYS